MSAKIEPTQADREAYIEWGGGMPERDRQTILAGEWDATTGMQVLARHAQAARAEGYEQAIRDAAEWLRGPSVPDHSDEGGCPFDKAAVAILKLLENRE